MDFSQLLALIQQMQEQIQAMQAAQPPPPQGVSPDQEKADIAAAVQQAIQPLNDQIAALQLAKEQEDQILALVQGAAQAILALFPQAPAPQPAPAPAPQPDQPATDPQAPAPTGN